MNNEKGIISKLNNIIETYTSYLIREVPDGKIFTKTILINTVLQRSLALIDGYQKLLETNNIIVLNALARLQIDNCIFVYGIYYLVSNGYNIYDLYKDILKNNKHLSDYKVNKQKLYDTFLVNQIDNENDVEFEKMYNFSCRFVHYSDSASYLTMETKENGIVNFSLSTNYERFSNQVMVNAGSFVNVSKFLLLMIKKYWENIDKGSNIN